jgi:2'-5' RNA ligase
VRLFVAVELGEHVQASAARVVEELKRRTASSAPHARVTWVQPGHLHLTLKFIGEVDPSRGRQVAAALESPLAASAFALTVEGTGTFPPKRPPRVVWAGITAGIDSLRSVEREVSSRLEQLISPADDRDYHPHVTLGRVKNPAGLRPVALLEGLTDVPFGVVQVAAVTLFESRLSSRGPTYTEIGRTALAPVS